MTFKGAKKDGALQSFAKPAHKNVTVAVLVIIAILSSAAMFGAGLAVGGCAILGAVLTFVYYRVSSYKNFGGITGDLAGWFLQVCEIAVLVGAVLGERLVLL